MYFPVPSYSLNIQGQLLDLQTPRVVAIVNVTPDSFFGDSRCGQPEALLQRVQTALAQGASIIDVGACSTRPGSTPVDEPTELARLMPALELLRKHFPDALLSVDTFRASVAERAVAEFGVGMINDVSEGEADVRMSDTVARLQVPYVLTLSTPQPSFEAGLRRLADKVAALRRLGLNDVVCDPGFGFGKTDAENWTYLARLSDLSLLETPLMVGLSRKSMICRLLDVAPQDALNGTTAAHMLALAGGASLLRVHDVRAAVECIKIHNACNLAQ